MSFRLAPAARPRPTPLRSTEPASAVSSAGAVTAELTRAASGPRPCRGYFSGSSRRRSSFSTASRMKTAIRRLPTRAWMRRSVSAGSLTVVGFIPRGGRPIASSLSTSRTMSNFIIVDATVYQVYDAVYEINDVVFRCNASVFCGAANWERPVGQCTDSRLGERKKRNERKWLRHIAARPPKWTRRVVGHALADERYRTGEGPPFRSFRRARVAHAQQGRAQPKPVPLSQRRSVLRHDRKRHPQPPG